MTQPENVPIEVTVSTSLFDLMQANSQRAFKKEVGELDFNEAARLVGATLMASAPHATSEGEATYEGRTIVGIADDGREAFEGFIHRKAKELAPQIDDDREIILNVVRNRTRWEVIRNRQPEVAQTYRFRNEPPQYA